MSTPRDVLADTQRFYRKCVHRSWVHGYLSNRYLAGMITAVFIAIGGLLPALGGSIIKLAETSPALSEFGSTLKYLGIFAGVVFLFIGFQLTTTVPAQTRPVPAAA